jgi:hypothetical protein
MRDKNITGILLRIGSVFVVVALDMVGAGAIAGINPILAAFMAGILAVSDVIKDLANSYVQDGKLTKEELNQAFAKVYKKRNAK